MYGRCFLSANANRSIYQFNCKILQWKKEPNENELKTILPCHFFCGGWSSFWLLMKRNFSLFYRFAKVLIDQFAIAAHTSTHPAQRKLWHGNLIKV